MCMNRYFGHFLGDGGEGGKRKVKSNLGIKKGYLVKMEKLRIFWHFLLLYDIKMYTIYTIQSREYIMYFYVRGANYTIHSRG